MQRSVSSYFEADVVDVSDIVLSVAVACEPDRVRESLVVTVDEHPIELTEVVAPHGGRIHLVENLPIGRMVVRYEAVVEGRLDPPPVTLIDRVTYLRTSRYVESDRMAAMAISQFHGLHGRALLAGVSSWVGVNIGYVLGSSRPSDGAVATLLGRQGVCRDFAHLVIAFLRACNTPARLVAVYAPGLNPMDFHAVVEAYVEGAWYVVDATVLAPRSTLVRIATGRDAADTAFLTSQRGLINLITMNVSAWAEPDPPRDDLGQLVQLT